VASLSYGTHNKDGNVFPAITISKQKEPDTYISTVKLHVHKSAHYPNTTLSCSNEKQRRLDRISNQAFNGFTTLNNSKAVLTNVARP